MQASDSLPYALFLILLELGVGGTLVMQAVDLRGQVTRGFIKSTTVMLPAVLGLALWVALTLDGDVVEGFRLDTSPRTAVVVLLAVMTAGSVLYNAALFTERITAGRVLGGVQSLLALAVVGLVAAMLHIPPASGVLVFLSLLAGSLAVGLAAVGLTLGHWYLVTPRLPARPLNEVTTLLLGILLLQVVLLALALSIRVDESPVGGRDRALADDVSFWLRIVVGLMIPLAFGWMAWAAARSRSMMAATGLLYLVTAAVLAGEIAARALFFDSARPI